MERFDERARESCVRLVDGADLSEIDAPPVLAA